MAYQCSICGETVEGDLLVFKDHTEKHIVDVIKAKYPEWVEKDGVCRKCLDYYREQVRGDSS